MDYNKGTPTKPNPQNLQVLTLKPKKLVMVIEPTKQEPRWLLLAHPTTNPQPAKEPRPDCEHNCRLWKKKEVDKCIQERDTFPYLEGSQHRQSAGHWDTNFRHRLRQRNKFIRNRTIERAKWIMDGRNYLKWSRRQKSTIVLQPRCMTKPLRFTSKTTSYQTNDRGIKTS